MAAATHGLPACWGRCGGWSGGWGVGGGASEWSAAHGRSRSGEVWPCILQNSVPCHGHWSLVTGHSHLSQSLVAGHWSLVTGRRSLVAGRSPVRSFVTGRSSLVAGPWSLDLANSWSLVAGHLALVVGGWPADAGRQRAAGDGSVVAIVWWSLVVGGWWLVALP